MKIKTKKQRCSWCTDDEIYIKYHDEEWGIPCFNETLLFEMLILEGAQAGLNWLTILKKRNGYKKAFDNFNYKKIAKYDEKKIEELKSNPQIIRNKLKIKSAIKNAQVFIEIQKEFNSFSNYIWSFVNNKPIKNHFKNINEIPNSTPLSQKISKDLKKRGMTFVGPTIIYAYMQAIGIVNDHTINCFKYNEN